MKIKILVFGVLIFLVSCWNSSGPSYLDKDELGYFSFNVNGEFWYPKTSKSILMPYRSHIVEAHLISENIYDIYLQAYNEDRNSFLRFFVDSVSSEGKYKIKGIKNEDSYPYGPITFKFEFDGVKYNYLDESNSWLNIENLKFGTSSAYDTVSASFHIVCSNNQNDTLILNNGYFYLLLNTNYAF